MKRSKEATTGLPSTRFSFYPGRLHKHYLNVILTSSGRQDHGLSMVNEAVSVEIVNIGVKGIASGNAWPD